MSEIKVEIGNEVLSELKIEPVLDPKIEDAGHQFVTNVDDQFDADGDLGMAQYVDESAVAESDIIGNLMVEDDAPDAFETAPEGTFITMNEGSHSEQFLTIPRGNTQITVCDDGNIIYSDENVVNSANQQLLQNVTGDLTHDDGTTFYYTEPNNDEQPLQMVTDNDPELIDAPEGAILDSNSITEGSIDTEAEAVNAIVTQDDVLQLGGNVISRNELGNFMILNDGQRGVKRPFLQQSPQKNTVTKVFIQNAGGSGGLSQPIKIIGNIGSVVGARSMSLRQAQRLGLIGTNTKVNRVVTNPMGSSGRMVVKKVISTPGTSAVGLKTPTKILPAPMTKVQIRSPGTVVKGNVSVANFMPVRSNLPISQFKAFNAINTSSVGPVAISRTVSGITYTKTDGKSPQKMFVRPGTVISDISQLARLPANATFQPIQGTVGKSQVQYLKLVGPGTAQVVAATKPKLSKPEPVRTIPIAPSPISPKPVATIPGKKILLAAPETTIQNKSLALPLSIKGKFTPTKHKLDDKIHDLEDDIEKLEGDDLDEFGEQDVDEECTRGSSPTLLLEANGIRPKKPCNCNKSQCLKLYCECFANGEFCFQCNCTNCYNNIEHETERQHSIKSCLERNPDAFRPKFQTEEEDRRNNKGCNCKRTSCLKNYCECFESKIPCSKSCKCTDCRNNEEHLDREGDQDEGDIERLDRDSPCLSPSLKDAFCKCILNQMETVTAKGGDALAAEKAMLEEFGQCLVKIIGNWNKKDSKV